MFSIPLIGSVLAVSFFIVSPLHSVGDDWSSLRSPWKPRDPSPHPPPQKKNLHPSPQAIKMTSLLHREDYETRIKLSI